MKVTYKSPFIYNEIWDTIEDINGNTIIFPNCSKVLINNIINLLNCDPHACKLINLEIIGEELYVNKQFIGRVNTSGGFRNYDDAKKYYSTIIKLLSDD